MNENKMLRRQFLKIGGGALAMIPVMFVSANANAATNASLRASLKYQEKPEGDKMCSNCTHFVPGSGSKGSCKIMPGDTEISAQGYCLGWTKKEA